MKVKSFLHAKLDVSNLARSECFYAGLLGLQEIVRYILDDGVILQLSPTGNSPGVELWYHDPPISIQDVNLHIAFAVDDTRAWVEYLRQQGVLIETEPFEKGHEIIAFIRDPDGYLIELNQVK